MTSFTTIRNQLTVLALSFLPQRSDPESVRNARNRRRHVSSIVLPSFLHSRIRQNPQPFFEHADMSTFKPRPADLQKSHAMMGKFLSLSNQRPRPCLSTYRTDCIRAQFCTGRARTFTNTQPLSSIASHLGRTPLAIPTVIRKKPFYHPGMGFLDVHTM